ncbi:MAG: hypothetical protein K1X74_01305 [Pirellulales bacterium]|nr:hypothetical protein [Pirellulales bacterium]
MRPELFLGLSFAAAMVGAAAWLWMLPRVARIFRGLNEPALYRPVAADELPPAVRRHFDEQAATFARQGLRVCGDYRVRRELEHFSRLLIDPAGHIACEVAWYRSWKAPLRVASLFSLLDDATFVETANRVIPPQDGELIVRTHRGASPAELVDYHRRLLATLRDERRTAPLALDDESLPLVAIYGAALMHERLAATRPGTVSPYAATLPQIRAAIERWIEVPLNEAPGD